MKDKITMTEQIFFVFFQNNGQTRDMSTKLQP